MKLTEDTLRKIIREEMIKEFTVRGTGGDQHLLFTRNEKRVLSDFGFGVQARGIATKQKGQTIYRVRKIVDGENTAVLYEKLDPREELMDYDAAMVREKNPDMSLKMDQSLTDLQWG
jgi:hypothetical protein